MARNRFDLRARDQDRDAAIEIVEAAWAEGQIVEADRDKRVEQLLQAQTLAEVQMITHDLQLPKTPPPPPAYGEAQVTVDEPVPVAKPRGGRGLWVLLLIPAVIVITMTAIVGWIIAAVVGSTTLQPGEDPGTGQINVLSEEGFADLVAALEEETGSSTVFEAVLYPTYAVVDVPVDATSGRAMSFYWDGDLAESGSRGTSDYERFDLADIDANVVVSVVDQARSRVEDPESWYAIIRAPREFDNDTWIYGYSSNQYNESGYLGTDQAGTITWDPNAS